MKFLIAIFVLVFSFTASALITNPFSNSFDNAGAVKTADKVHITVKNSTVSTIPDGSVVVLDTTADDGASVIISNSLSLKPFCVVDTSDGILASGLGKCLVFGVKDNIKYAGTAPTLGDNLYLSGSVAGSTVDAATATVTNYALQPVAVSLDSASSPSGYVQGFVNTL